MLSVMPDEAPSYLAGYHAAKTAGPSVLVAIPIPLEYTERQRIDFVSGFLVGARDRRNAELMDELEDTLMQASAKVMLI